MYSVFFKKDGKIYCFIKSASRMRRHKIWYEILFLSDALGYFVKSLLKGFISLDMRFAHFVKNDCRTVLRSNFKLTAYMVLDKFTHEFIVFIFHKIIVAYSGANEHFFYSLDLSYFAKHSQIFGMIGFEGRAGSWCEAFLSHAKSAAKLLFARGVTKISCRSADIVDISLEIGHFCYTFRFFED